MILTKKFTFAFAEIKNIASANKNCASKRVSERERKKLEKLDEVRSLNGKSEFFARKRFLSQQRLQMKMTLAPQSQVEMNNNWRLILLMISVPRHSQRFKCHLAIQRHGTMQHLHRNLTLPSPTTALPHIVCVYPRRHLTDSHKRPADELIDMPNKVASLMLNRCDQHT